MSADPTVVLPHLDLATSLEIVGDALIVELPREADGVMVRGTLLTIGKTDSLGRVYTREAVERVVEGWKARRASRQ